MITDWNSDGFDWPYLLERAKRVEATKFPYLDRLLHHKVKMHGYPAKAPKFAGRASFDAMHMVRAYIEKVSLENTSKPDSYGLNNIANRLLGRGKLDLSIPEMRKAYERGEVGQVAEYCLVDAQLPLQILQHEKILPLLFQLANVSGSSIQQALNMTNSSLVISSLAHAVNDRGYVNNLPKTDHGNIQGGFVLEPTTGLHECLAIMDFAALYPSIIISYNICYTTVIPVPDLDGSSTTVNLSGGRQVHFTSKKPGLIPQELKHFMDQRSSVKAMMGNCQKGSEKYCLLDFRQQGIKTICNTFYGFLGSQLPFAFPVLAECVTRKGRQAITKTKNYLENLGYTVPFGDTDSCAPCFPKSMDVEKVEQKCTELARVISSELFGNKLTLEYEKQLRPCLIFKKKMYAGYDPRTDQLLIKGLSAKRRDSMPWVRNTFQTVLELLCREGDIERAYSYVEERFKTLLKVMGKGWEQTPIPLEDFALTSKIKHKSEYKDELRLPLAYRVNQKAPQPLGPGERVSYIYYYDSEDEKHNGSKRSGTWLPGNNIDTVLPLEVMKERPGCEIDVLKVLTQHENELQQYFRAVSDQFAAKFKLLYESSREKIFKSRGSTKIPNVKFLKRELNI